MPAPLIHAQGANEVKTQKQLGPQLLTRDRCSTVAFRASQSQRVRQMADKRLPRPCHDPQAPSCDDAPCLDSARASPPRCSICSWVRAAHVGNQQQQRSISSDSLLSNSGQKTACGNCRTKNSMWELRDKKQHVGAASVTGVVTRQPR